MKTFSQKILLIINSLLLTIIGGIVIATQITSSNIWTTSATNGDVITADAWNALVTKAKSAGGACSAEGAINCSISSPSTSYVNSWSCKYGFDTVNKKCKGPSGTCGSDNGLSIISTPTNLCSLGTPSSVTDNGIGNTYSWTCNGSDGGTNSSCTANHVNFCIKGASSCSVTPATNCNWFVTNGNSSGDGVYWIDPDGATGNPPFKAYCDMTNDGGGWTMVAGIKSSGNEHGTISAVTPGNLISTTGKGKYSDDTINQIVSSHFKLFCGTHNLYAKKFSWTSISAPSAQLSSTYNGTYSACGGAGGGIESRGCAGTIGVNIMYQRGDNGCLDTNWRNEGILWAK